MIQTVLPYLLGAMQDFYLNHKSLCNNCPHHVTIDQKASRLHTFGVPGIINSSTRSPHGIFCSLSFKYGIQDPYPKSWYTQYLDFESSQNNGPHPKTKGTWAIILGTYPGGPSIYHLHKSWSTLQGSSKNEKEKGKGSNQGAALRQHMYRGQHEKSWFRSSGACSASSTSEASKGKALIPISTVLLAAGGRRWCGGAADRDASCFGTSRAYLTLFLQGLIFQGFWAQRPYYLWAI